MIGYARVSTTSQTLEAQLEQLKAAGCTAIYREKAPGEQTDRRELRRAIAALPLDGVLVVTRLDRLARSTRDLLNMVAEIEARGGRFKSLAETWADTTTPAGRLMLTILGGLAEFERSLIRERTTEGRSRAKTAGKHLGRPPLLTREQQQDAHRYANEGMMHKEIGKRLRVSRSTVSRFLARQRGQTKSTLHGQRTLKSDD
jgi:DNA invertase Pin-like site-specific DNA recombinase